MIEAQGLTKHYGAVRALEAFDLKVEEGDVVGYLGPNGSGNTTTIRLLLGLIRPTSCRVAVLGGDPERDAVAIHRSLSYVSARRRRGLG